MANAAVGLRMKKDLVALLDQTATVYTRTAGGGFTTPTKTGLLCLLQPVNAQPPATSSDRSALNDMRTLYYDPDYATMPDDGVIEGSAEPGVRWNIIRGTITPDVGPGEVVVMRHCDLRRSR